MINTNKTSTFIRVKTSGFIRVKKTFLGAITLHPTFELKLFSYSQTRLFFKTCQVYSILFDYIYLI